MSIVASDDVMAEINITPLTDVMLVLLIIFTMLSALVLPPGFQKQLASGDEAYPAPPSRTVEVLVNDNDRIFVEGRPSDLAHIYVAMRDWQSVAGAFTSRSRPIKKCAMALSFEFSTRRRSLA